MYIEDLSPYVYLNREPNPHLLAIGWLDEKHDFPKGKVPDEVLEKILALCFQPVNATRGIHPSPFIPRNPKEFPTDYPVEYKGKQTALGSAEIRVQGENGKSYAAPNLIYHYIKDCGYMPPQEFLDALNSISDV